MTIFTDYDRYKAAISTIEAYMDIYSARMKELAGDKRESNGLTPDHIKFSPEYRAAKQGFDTEFEMLRRVNRANVKRFQKQIKADIQARRERKTQNVNS